MKIYFNEIIEKYKIDKALFEVLNGALILYNKANKKLFDQEVKFVAESFFPYIDMFLKTHPSKDNFKYKPERLHTLDFSNDIIEKDKKITIFAGICLRSFISDYVKSNDPLEYLKEFFTVVISHKVDTVDIKYVFNEHKNTIWASDESLKTGLLGDVSFFNDSSVSSELSIEVSTYPEDIGRTYNFFAFFTFLNENDNTIKLNKRLSEFIFEGKKLTQEEINTYDLIYDANFEKLNEYKDFIFPITLNKKTNVIKNKL